MDLDLTIGPMTLAAWTSFVIICLLGAISPGPSLAVILRHPLGGGGIQGVICALSHGFGIFVWGSLMVGGGGLLVISEPKWFDAIQLGGAVFLFYLGIRAITAKRKETEFLFEPISTSRAQAAIEGFLIALFNPKIAFFFAAVFSQFIHADAQFAERMTLAIMAASIDAAWYCSVVFVVSRSMTLHRLATWELLFNRLFGVVILIFAVGIFVRW